MSEIGQLTLITLEREHAFKALRAARPGPMRRNARGEMPSKRLPTLYRAVTEHGEVAPTRLCAHLRTSAHDLPQWP
eukprot:CAMPEP_0171205590 /NCGR_PEP_ID=MMETSP0790-20130122/26628_1 /TAXON_ID=2925 /ORGANISM="Alexandrium catenella, Strain OF101" /LENGTH=75 /DNA_ID=CAMNT_0011671113 /DNA_START=30 /DNA_END=254 /DNA_ORIENTATION=-